MFKKCLVILFTLFVSYSVFHRLGVSKPVKVAKNKYKETDKAFCSVLKDLNYWAKNNAISCHNEGDKSDDYYEDKVLTCLVNSNYLLKVKILENMQKLKNKCK